MSLIFVQRPIAVNSSRYSPDDAANTTNPLHSFDPSNENDGRQRIASNFFDPTTVSHVLRRLYTQRTKMIEFYDREITLGEVKGKLDQFLDQIDYLLHHYEQDQSNHNLLTTSHPTTSDAGNYEEYFQSQRTNICSRPRRASFHSSDITDSNDVQIDDLLVEETTPVDW